MSETCVNELLETLRQQVDCAYMSDLHTAACRAPLRAALQGLDAAAYGPEAWYGAARYIARRQPPADQSAAEMQGWLCDHLSDES